MKYIMILCILIIIALLIMGFKLADFSLGIRRQTLEEARKWQDEHYDTGFYDALEKTDYTVKSYDDYLLHVEFLKNPHPTNRYVIISHGYTDNHIGSLKYTDTYLDLGFNVIIYDLRGHGENEVTFCSYSIRESKDLIALIEDTRKRYPDLKILGLHGESLGSATTVASLQYKPDVQFAIADCGFSEITSVMQNGLKAMHLPPFLVHVASFCAKIKYGYYYHQMRPIDALKDNRIPLCFIHGEKDDFIVPRHSFNMQKANKGYAEVHIITDATHAASVLTDKESYRTIIQNFLQKENIL